MTQNDSFIHEVTEEVRRDKLFAAFRKYGWVLAAVTVLVIGGAGVNEWLKARAQAEAEAVGDALLAAIANSDPAVQNADLAKLAETAGNATVMVQFLQAASLLQADDVAGSAVVLNAIAASADTPPVLQDIARLKSVMIQGEELPQADRLELLAPLVAAGAPLRMLALEQRALAYLDAGGTDAAILDLMVIFESAEASQPAQNRAGQLLVALGAELPQVAAASLE